MRMAHAMAARRTVFAISFLICVIDWSNADSVRLTGIVGEEGRGKENVGSDCATD